MIETARPHYLLFAVASCEDSPGRWRFVLRTADGAHRLEASDIEPEASGERLELITVVRGLEALEQPSHVTLVTPSTYIREGVLRGVTQWKAAGWRWECFGQMVPVKHLDLWQRIDRAMRFHEVDCRTYRVDPPHRTLGSPRAAALIVPINPATTERRSSEIHSDPLEMAARNSRRRQLLHQPGLCPAKPPLRSLWARLRKSSPWLHRALGWLGGVWPRRTWLQSHWFGPRDRAKLTRASRAGERVDGGSAESSPAGPPQVI
jgi:ribonuclease HI